MIASNGMIKENSSMDECGLKCYCSKLHEIQKELARSNEAIAGLILALEQTRLHWRDCLGCPDMADDAIHAGKIAMGLYEEEAYGE